MGFIRERSKLKTGYQEIENWSPKLDLQCDFVMAYGINETLENRIDTFREKGYEVHLMTGCAWGEYEDYLSGAWDNKKHWEESQTDRNGKRVEHGINTPYMVPTLTFVDYLTQKICGLVDKGISAIHMEEPEFWDAGGFSTAFAKEYEDYYKEPYRTPDSSLDARYRCSELKALLYARLVEKLSKAVKEYSREKYGREISFYVATHSLINYTQWKIMSPESRLLDMDNVDGFIAQVWSGTSGTGNVYEGRYGARTFETAFLEYGIMQEMTRCSGKSMWFLHDPVEDYPENGWGDYRKKYLKTLTASLFWPHISSYEVCPWPNRVFNGRYPRKLGIAGGMIPTDDMDGARDIPREYATLLSGMIQTLGDMEQENFEFMGNAVPVGIIMSDTGMFQRTYPKEAPDAPYPAELFEEENVMTDRILSFERTKEEGAFYQKMHEDKNLLLRYAASCAYPNFFGLAMPLLKHGLPLQPVYLENTKRYDGYLDAFRYLILSYEHMKPSAPEDNIAVADWVKRGGCLIYVGDGSDPYHGINGWWKHADFSYANPAEHLFELLFLKPQPQNGIYPAGKGSVAIYRKAPAVLTVDAKTAGEYRHFVRDALLASGYEWKETNHLIMQRGPYRITAVMSESGKDEPCVTAGLYADLLADGYPIIHRAVVEPDEEGMLFDFSKIEQDALRIVASAARIEKLECRRKDFTITEKAAAGIHVYTRLRLPFEPVQLEAADEDKNTVPIAFTWDEETRTVLFSYDSTDRTVTVTGYSIN